jgi:hypothetical protein
VTSARSSRSPQHRPRGHQREACGRSVEASSGSERSRSPILSRQRKSDYALTCFPVPITEPSEPPRQRGGSK